MQTIVRSLVDLRDRTLQKSRIGFSNRLAAIESGADQADDEIQELIQKYYEMFDDLEKQIDEDIKTLVQDVPIFHEMSAVKGIGPTLSAKLISMIDIERAPTISALWRYAGYAVIDGQREKPVKGEPLHYNKRLKTSCYLVSSSFLKSSSPYRSIYDAAREYYDIKKPDWTKGHKHNAAMRKMTKIFLSHLWIRWRELEGLSITDPYVHAKLDHNSYHRPEDFGWPDRANEPE